MFCLPVMYSILVDFFDLIYKFCVTLEPVYICTEKFKSNPTKYFSIYNKYFSFIRTIIVLLVLTIFIFDVSDQTDAEKWNVTKIQDCNYKYYIDDVVIDDKYIYFTGHKTFGNTIKILYS